MVRIGTCVACQYGNHDGHQRVMRSVREGMLGGVVCGCKGECEGKPEPHIKREIDVIDRAFRQAAVRRSSGG